MSYINLLLSEVNENFKIVTVKFPSSPKQYHYKTVLDVSAGDFIVVDTPSEGFKVVQVIESTPAIEMDLQFNFDLKWVVSKVDVEHYEKCKKMEREATKVVNQLRYAKQRKELIDQIQSRIGDDGLNTVRALVRL